MERSAAPRRVLWKAVAFTGFGLQAVGLVIQYGLRPVAGSAPDVVGLVAYVAGFVLAVFGMILDTQATRREGRSWEDARQRELERRHHRLENDPLPSGREEE
jgi:hypothetical protein